MAENMEASREFSPQLEAWGALACRVHAPADDVCGATAAMVDAMKDEINGESGGVGSLHMV